MKPALILFGLALAQTWCSVEEGVGPYRPLDMTGEDRIQLEGLKLGLEAPSGVEPLHRSFADCSLNHLGTAPRAHYSLGKG